jgi:amino acid transporter
VAGWGYTDPETFSKDLSGAQQPFFALATRAFGALGPLAMFLLITNSLYAVGIAGTNAVTRVYYSLGRAGIFPAALGRIHPKTRTPTNAILLQGALAVLIAYIFGFALGVEPIVAYGLHGLLMTIGAVIVYMMTNLSCFMLYRKQYPNEFNVLNHLIIPVLATVVFIPPMAASLFPETLSVIGMGFSNSYPVTLALPISIVWAVIGIVVYLWLRSARPGALERMANEMAVVELVGEEQDSGSRATTKTPVR